MLEIIQLFSNYTGQQGFTKSFSRIDKKLQEKAGCSFFRLHGCPHECEHVYIPGDDATHCPRCGKERYHEKDGKRQPLEVRVIRRIHDALVTISSIDNNTTPFQEVFYFPLKPRLQALLKTPQFRKLINHEHDRPSNENFVSDVYDTDAWRNLVADCGGDLRIILQFCIDAIPAFANNSLSLKPAEFINLSLPPAIRSKAANILLLMLVPASMKRGQKKYFDFAARYELNELCATGIDGVRVKVFGTSLDTKGREEMTGPANTFDDYLQHVF